MLCVVLKSRFGSIPEEVAERIGRTTDINLLEKWGTLAVTELTLDDFRREAGI
jgi:hypothetical protein